MQVLTFFDKMRKSRINLLLVLLVTIGTLGQCKLPAVSNRQSLNEDIKDERKINPDTKRSTCELVTSRGFPCEVHTIRTTRPSGYLIEAHRIRLYKIGKPIILQTGLIGTSADFVMASDQVSRNPAVIGQNMAIELAKQGYDVWMTNNRGNEYGLVHDTLSSKNSKFWKFTFDEMALVDVPAFIEYIRNKTRSRTVGFVGHSQGSAVMFALLSNTTRYNNVVKPFIAISPITRIGKATTFFRTFLDWIHPLLEAKDAPFFTKNDLLSAITALGCANPISLICRTVFFSVVGFDNQQLNSSRLEVYTGHMPTSTSARNLLHFHQLFKSNKFQRYDFGKEGNLKHYGQTTAPLYNLTRISHKSIYVIYAANDLFVPVSSVKRLKADIPGAKEWYLIKNSKANHIDPLIGINISVEVNKKIIQILRRIQLAE